MNILSKAKERHINMLLCTILQAKLELVIRSNLRWCRTAFDSSEFSGWLYTYSIIDKTLLKKWLVLHSTFRGRRLRRYDQRFWARDVALQVMGMITYARKEISRAPRLSWMARFHTFIKLASNDLKVKVSYFFCWMGP